MPSANSHETTAEQHRLAGALQQGRARGPEAARDRARDHVARAPVASPLQAQAAST
jgi:hypothetical protein